MSKSDSKDLLESFLDFIKKNSSNSVKILNFGTFYNHKSPKRIGRNPKTKEEFIISKREKLFLRHLQSLKIS